MKVATKMSRYLRSGGSLNEKWGLLCAWRKRYASYLAREYGYPVNVAIQRAYIFGYDKWPYDYRAGRFVQETRSRRSFG